MLHRARFPRPGLRQREMQGAVDLGGIEEGHPKIDRLAQQGDHLGLVGRRALVCAHAHTAEADGDLRRANGCGG
jgi:hypothetical protein